MMSLMRPRGRLLWRLGSQTASGSAIRGSGIGQGIRISPGHQKTLTVMLWISFTIWHICCLSAKAPIRTIRYGRKPKADHASVREGRDELTDIFPPGRHFHAD